MVREIIDHYDTRAESYDEQYASPQWKIANTRFDQPSETRKTTTAKSQNRTDRTDPITSR